MDITSNPNLKPYRNYSPWEEINGLFAANVATLNKGTFVTIATYVSNTNVLQSGNSASASASSLVQFTANGNNAPNYAYSPRWALAQRVRAAQSGEVVLGMTLKDVKETNTFGEPFVFRPRHETDEQQIVPSGKAVPIVTRGIFLINGYSGTPDPTGTNNGVSFVSGGKLVCGPYVAGRVGKWLSGPDADGYALFKLEC